MYIIEAHVTQEVDGWLSVTHVPKFLLSADQYGIASEEHAAKVAREVIDPLDSGMDIHITATKY